MASFVRRYLRQQSAIGHKKERPHLEHGTSSDFRWRRSVGCLGEGNVHRLRSGRVFPPTSGHDSAFYRARIVREFAESRKRKHEPGRENAPPGGWHSLNFVFNLNQSLPLRATCRSSSLRPLFRDLSQWNQGSVRGITHMKTRTEAQECAARQ